MNALADQPRHVVAVVEDDAFILDAVRLVLEGYGWEVCTYATAEEFLTDLDEGRVFHCLLLDPHLPALSGADVIRAMGPDPLPFVVLTARPDSAVTRTLRDLGARAVIQKPVAASALTAVIESVMTCGA